MTGVANRAAPALAVEGLSKTFVSGGGFLGSAVQRVRAVDGVGFSVAPRQSLGLVGESGCGKSTVARCILRLIEPDAGTIRFMGEDLGSAPPGRLDVFRRRIQIVFQDPYSSLNPRRTIRQTLAEPVRVHGVAKGNEVEARVRNAVAEVGLSADILDRYPHEFSGGQRQRIGIARALIHEPEFIIADEPVSALDVSVQAQVLRLLIELRERRRLGFLFVSHDLGVVRYFCSDVAVMYLGRIVEAGPVKEVFHAPLHPYTRLLIESSPVPDPTQRRELARATGEVPSASDPPAGCAFHPRCPHATERCRSEKPELKSQVENRRVACHLHD